MRSGWARMPSPEHFEAGDWSTRRSFPPPTQLSLYADSEIGCKAMEHRMFGNPEEYLYLHMLLRWERTAPPDKCLGTLDNEPAKNTQTARMAKVLQMVTGLSDLPMEKLRKETERKDCRSTISKDAAWMEARYKLGKGWSFEGCMSLVDKQRIRQSLPQLVLSSREFANCAADFVGGKSVERYLPDKEQAGRQIEQWNEKLETRG